MKRAQRARGSRLNEVGSMETKTTEEIRGKLEGIEERESSSGKTYVALEVEGETVYCWRPRLAKGLEVGRDYAFTVSGGDYPRLVKPPVAVGGTVTPTPQTFAPREETRPSTPAPATSPTMQPEIQLLRELADTLRGQLCALNVLIRRQTLSQQAIALLCGSCAGTGKTSDGTECEDCHGSGLEDEDKIADALGGSL